MNARTFRDEPSLGTRAQATDVAAPEGNQPSGDGYSSSSSSSNAYRASQRAIPAPAPRMTVPQSSRQSTPQCLTTGHGPHDRIEHMLSRAYHNSGLISNQLELSKLGVKIPLPDSYDGSSSLEIFENWLS